MTEEYEEIRERVKRLIPDIDGALTRYVEKNPGLEDLKQFIVGYAAIVLESIEKCDILAASMNLGYLAVEIDRFYSTAKDTVLAARLEALYILLCMLLARSVDRCARYLSSRRQG